MRRAWRGGGLTVLGTLIGGSVGYGCSLRAVNVSAAEAAFQSAVCILGGAVVGAFVGYAISKFFDNKPDSRDESSR